jgi:hypothetical protein
MSDMTINCNSVEATTIKSEGDMIYEARFLKEPWN